MLARGFVQNTFVQNTFFVVSILFWNTLIPQLVIFRPPSDGGLMTPQNVGVDFFHFVLKSE